VKKKNIRKRRKRSHTSPLLAEEQLSTFIAKDFSTLEDNVLAFQLIKKLANNAGKYAAAEAKARGLGTVYARGNGLVKVSAIGEAVSITPALKRESFYVKYKPATILHAVKK
jgi:hypothetical protein